MLNILAKIGLIIFLSIFFNGCISDKEIILNQLKGIDISIKDDFKVLKFKSQDLSDIIYQFEIVVTPSDSIKITNEIKSRKYFIYGIPKKKQLEPEEGNLKEAYYEKNYYYLEYLNDSTVTRKCLFFYPAEKKIKYTYYDG